MSENLIEEWQAADLTLRRVERNPGNLLRVPYEQILVDDGRHTFFVAAQLWDRTGDRDRLLEDVRERLQRWAALCDEGRCGAVHVSKEQP